MAQGEILGKIPSRVMDFISVSNKNSSTFQEI